jgi:hypothetical protein
MATRFANPFPRFFTDNAALLSGGKLYFYVDDGGTTPKNSYSDNALSVANTNPVILSSSGVIPDIFLDGTYRIVLQNGDGVQIDSAENVNAGSSDFVSWADWDSGVDYASGPATIVTGSNGKYYKSIDTPNQGNDPISSPLFWSRVYLIGDTDPTMGGPLNSNSHQIQWSKGADVASATALPVLTDGNYFDVTGTTAITSINTTKIGTIVKLHFDGILTLTHHATNLILPGAANITTAAGDEAEFIEYATGDYRCTNYSRASGGAVTGGALVFISSATASSDATVDFTGISSTYDEYEIHLLNVIPVDDIANIWMRTSTDGGSSFDSGASNYAYGFMYTAGSIGTITSAGDTKFVFSNDTGSVANELGVSGVIRIIRPSEATYTNVIFNGGHVDSTARPGPISAYGSRLSAANVDAVQFLFDSGNVESGLFALYGVKRT